MSRIGTATGYALIALTLLYSSVACALPPSRRALIFGNDNYPGNALHNARNDARSVEQAWRSLGYTTTLVLDSDRTHMNRAADQFAESINTGDTALVYYAGHGLQVDGENYLVPTDFRAFDAADAKVQGYSLSYLLQKLIEHGATTQIVILDACRDNPFQFTRGMRDGWAPAATSAGSFLVFGTSPGSTAGDSPGDDHGVFTKSLLRYITDPQLDVEQLFQRVRRDVITSSGGKQVPWTASSLIGAFHMVPESDVTSPRLAQLGDVSPSQNKIVVRGLGVSIAKADSPGNSEDVVELVAQARGLIRRSYWSEAGRILSSALMLDPRCAIALRLLAVVLHASGRSVEAESALARATELEPGPAYAYRCLFRAGRAVALSADDCTRALQLEDGVSVAHVGLALNWLASNNNKQATEEVDKAIAVDPHEPSAFLLKATMLEAEGRLQEATSNYLKATQFSINLLP